jgi:hypothetical protein
MKQKFRKIPHNGIQKMEIKNWIKGWWNDSSGKSTCLARTGSAWEKANLKDYKIIKLNL